MIYLAVFILAIVADALAVKYLKYLTSGLILKTMILSVILTVIGYIHIFVVIEKDIWLIVCDGVGANLGVYIGMKIKDKI